MKVSAAISGAVLLTAVGFAADQQAATLPPGRQTAAPKEAPQVGLGRPGSGCYTNARRCAGDSFISNENDTPISCAIFWDNGRYGRSEFTLEPLQNMAHYVRYGDTYACVQGRNPPPNVGAQRYWLWVEQI